MDFFLLVIVCLISYLTYRGLKDSVYFNKYLFEVDSILVHKEYYRLFSSGFIHVNWFHLAFNMMALYSFGLAILNSQGLQGFLVIYFASLIGGNLLALIIHRNHGDYSAVGASGAVSGLVYASILAYPYSEISLIFIPVGIPAWIFGLVFMVISIFGIKRNSDNIGHEAHLGGAITGLITMAILNPQILLTQYLIFLVLFIPSAAFIYLIMTKPEILMIDNYGQYRWARFKQEKSRSRQIDNSQELDRILDKINSKGMKSLNKREKRFLQRHSQEKG